MGVHVVLLSLDTGTLLPALYDGEAGVLYTNLVVRPLLAILHAGAFNGAVLAIAWSALGCAIYGGIEYLHGSYKAWRSTERDIQMEGEGRIVPHPLEHEFITRLLWRLGMGICMISFLVVTAPLIGNYLAIDAQIFTQGADFKDTLSVAYAIFGWACILHVEVVLLRLYVGRTRLFEEILY